MSKVTMVLEDQEGGRPMFDVEVDGMEEKETSLAYSIAVLLRMCLDILNTTYRKDFVDFVGTLHNAIRTGQIESAKAEFGEGDQKCH